MHSRQFIKVKCKQKNCPQFKRCPEIPTEINIAKRDSKITVLLVGEAGGRTEEEECQPFVGVSGELLRRIISYVMAVYGKEVSFAISNICRCHPTDDNGANRRPTDKEVENCIYHLIRDIGRIKPQLICTLGETAHTLLSPTSAPLRESHGMISSVNIAGTKYRYMCSYHPASIVRTPEGMYLPFLINDLKAAFNKLYWNLRIEKYESIELDTIKKVKRTFSQFVKRKSTGLAVDVETSSLNRVAPNRLLSTQFCDSIDKVAYFLPLGHKDSPFSPSELNTVFGYLADLLTNPDALFKYWLAHQAKFEIAIFKNVLNVNIIKPVVCTMTYAYLLEESYSKAARGFGTYGLKYLSNRYGFTYPKKYVEARTDLENKLTYEEFIDYGTMDAYATQQLFEIFNTIADSEDLYKKKAIRLLIYIYSRLYKVIAQAERNGIAIDLYRLRKLLGRESLINRGMEKIEKKFSRLPSVVETNKRLARSVTSAHNLFGSPYVFDINKEKSRQILFSEVLELEPVKEGKERTSFDQEFQDNYKSIKEVSLFSEYMKLKKLKTSYIKSIYEFLDVKAYPDNADGRVHPSFHTDTLSGRLRAEDPNPQQIPRGDSPIKRAVRNIYCAPPGRVIVEMDNMASEVRSFGNISNDEEMINIFRTEKKLRDKYRKREDKEKLKELAGRGFHDRMAQLAKVTRPEAKVIVFGGIFGQSDMAAAAQMKCTPREAREKYNKIFGTMKQAQEWLLRIEKVAERQLYVESPLGRRRHLYNFLLGMDRISAKSRRRGRNSPIQGLSADFADIAAGIFFEEYIVPNELEEIWKIINLVHDASYFDIPIKDIRKFVKASEPYFTSEVTVASRRDFGYDPPIPIEVEYKFGLNSGNTIKWDFTSSGLEEIIKELIKRDKKRLKHWQSQPESD
jgi:DNA polymerase-1